MENHCSTIVPHSEFGSLCRYEEPIWIACSLHHPTTVALLAKGWWMMSIPYPTWHFRKHEGSVYISPDYCTETYRTHVKELIRFCWVQKVQELNFKHDCSIGRDQWRAAQNPKGIAGLKEVSCQLSFLHRQKSSLHTSKSNVWEGKEGKTFLSCVYCIISCSWFLQASLQNQTHFRNTVSSWTYLHQVSWVSDSSWSSLCQKACPCVLSTLKISLRNIKAKESKWISVRRSE